MQHKIRLSHVRHRLGINQKTMSSLTGITMSRISEIERDIVKPTHIQQRMIEYLEYIRRLERDGKCTFYADRDIDVFRFG